jgi:hypothetical protein
MKGSARDARGLNGAYVRPAAPQPAGGVVPGSKAPFSRDKAIAATLATNPKLVLPGPKAPFSRDSIS